MAETYILVRDQFGNILTTVRNWHRLEYFRKENTVGYLYLDLDPSQVDPLVFSNLQVDYRLEPWRQVGGNVPYLDGETIFFCVNGAIRLIRRAGSVSGWSAETLYIFWRAITALIRMMTGWRLFPACPPRMPSRRL
jgi:hypothetical protein